MNRYRLIRRAEIELGPGLPEHSSGLTRAVLIGGHTGATHTGLTLVALEDGHVDTHLHSFESSFYVLAGEPVLYLDGHGVRLKENACGAIPVGVPHAWRSDGHAEWIEMASPRPRGPDQFPRGRVYPGASRLRYARTGSDGCAGRPRETGSTTPWIASKTCCVRC
jgi:mannose-6-phosphate isomerase-like protein (cupin superfamily)